MSTSQTVNTQSRCNDTVHVSSITNRKNYKKIHELLNNTGYGKDFLCQKQKKEKSVI